MDDIVRLLHTVKHRTTVLILSLHPKTHWIQKSSSWSWQSSKTILTRIRTIHDTCPQTTRPLRRGSDTRGPERISRRPLQLSLSDNRYILRKSDHDIFVLSKPEIVADDFIGVLSNFIWFGMIQLNLSKIPRNDIWTNTNAISLYKLRDNLVTMLVSFSLSPVLNLAGVKRIFWPPLMINHATCWGLVIRSFEKRMILQL